LSGRNSKFKESDTVQIFAIFFGFCVGELSRVDTTVPNLFFIKPRLFSCREIKINGFVAEDTISPRRVELYTIGVFGEKSRGTQLL